MKYDLVIVSKSSTPELIAITQQCIDSALAECEVNVILIETSAVLSDFKGVNKTIHITDPFNYNRCLNRGLRECTGDIHILANNDIIFRKGWSKIGDQMREYGFHSASAMSNDPRQRGFGFGDWIYEGYNIGAHVTGWCLFVTRECIERIGKLDETFQFWYSDNVYVDQLKRHGIRHGLFCNIQVDHIASMTLKTLPWRDQRRYSVNARQKYLMYAK